MQKEIEKEKLIKEAFAIGKYICKKRRMSSLIVNQYILLHKHKSIVPSAKEQSLMRLCINYNLFFSLADSGLKYIQPQSVFMQKLYYMSAIMETAPEYYDFYISDKNEKKYISLIKIFYTGLWAVCKIIIGYIFIKIYFFIKK